MRPGILAASDALFSRLQRSRPFFLFAGPNVVESTERCVRLAGAIRDVGDRLGLTFVFKASFDKANRTSGCSYRGPGLDGGLHALRAVRERIGVPVLSDVHEPAQAALAAEVVDVLQIPAFLCRQTDLLAAAAGTGRIVHIKKGQWCGPATMAAAADKVRAAGNPRVIVCERGTAFGYNDQLVDPRSLVWLREAGGLVTADVTHALQLPGCRVDAAGDVCAGGHRELIPAIARTAAAVGVDGLFMEIHDDPLASPCDAPTQWPLRHLPELLGELCDIAHASRGREPAADLNLTPMNWRH